MERIREKIHCNMRDEMKKEKNEIPKEEGK